MADLWRVVKRQDIIQALAATSSADLRDLRTTVLELWHLSVRLSHFHPQLNGKGGVSQTGRLWAEWGSGNKPAARRGFMVLALSGQAGPLGQARPLGQAGPLRHGRAAPRGRHKGPSKTLAESGNTWPHAPDVTDTHRHPKHKALNATQVPSTRRTKRQVTTLLNRPFNLQISALDAEIIRDGFSR
ncbi:hypothetical protein AAG570_001299 [Ranatra chinensis]|uniref:Uncharacterized protein n=1 Tax=Ranatra chinensis TaxID=642074 RepID=A0ABD0YBG6_9HEMI